MPAGPGPREPEKLLVPAEEVGQLLTWGLSTQLGAAWWRGFAAAHGYPSWLGRTPGAGAWRLLPEALPLVPVRPAPAPPADPQEEA